MARTNTTTKRPLHLCSLLLLATVSVPSKSCAFSPAHYLPYRASTTIIPSTPAAAATSSSSAAATMLNAATLFYLDHAGVVEEEEADKLKIQREAETTQLWSSSSTISLPSFSEPNDWVVSVPTSVRALGGTTLLLCATHLALAVVESSVTSGGGTEVQAHVISVVKWAAANGYLITVVRHFRRPSSSY